MECELPNVGHSVKRARWHLVISFDCRVMLKSILVDLLAAAASGFAGFLTFLLLIRHGWFDGPSGGLVIFPLVFLPAVGFGLYGCLSALAKLRRSKLK